MENLDLDINNYSLKDLERFFKLKSTYNSNDVELKEYQIREQLLNSGHIDKRLKRDFIAFLTDAKKLIINAKCKPNEKPPTIIPKNNQLDTLNTPLSKIPLTRETELVQRPETQYIYTNNSDYFPGVINPLNKRIITKCLNIDTKFRDTLTTTQSSDFTIQLTTKLNKVVSMELSAIEIPFTFYNISQHNGNNYLYLKIICDPSTILNNNYGEKNIVHEENIFLIPDGNYTATDLINKLNSIISPQDENGNFIDPGNIFSYVHFKLDVTENGSGSGKVIIEPFGENAAYVKSISFDFTKNINGVSDSTNIATRIGWTLGFNRAYYDNNFYYIGESVIDCNNNRYIYLSIDDYNKNSNNSFISVFNQSILNDDIIARISIAESPGIVKENKINFITEPRQYFGPVDVQRLRIRLFDEFGRILQMNGANYSFCLKLNLLYDL